MFTIVVEGVVIQVIRRFANSFEVPQYFFDLVANFGRRHAVNEILIKFVDSEGK